MPIAVHTIDPVATYRRGIAAVLPDDEFEHVDPPVEPPEWITDPGAGRRVLLVTTRSDEQWQLVERLDIACPAQIVVAILARPAPADYRRALAEGCCAATPWDAPPNRIVDVIRAALDDHSLLPADIACWLANQGRAGNRPQWLTDEEAAWLQDLADGASIGALAARCGQAERTVHRRLHALYAKMNVANRGQAVREASQWGLVNDPPNPQ